MASGLQVARLEVAYNGEDRHVAPGAVRPGGAYLAENYLSGEKGRMRQRGPISQEATNTYTGVPFALGGNDKLLLGSADVPANGFLRPWDSIWNIHYSTAAANLVDALIGANTMRVFDANAAITNVTPTDRMRIPSGVRSVRVGKFVYAQSLDGNNDTANAPGGANGVEITNYGSYERLTRLIRWDSSGTAEPVVYVNAPQGAQDLKLWYNRLLVLGGRDPVTIGNGIDHNALWYTDNLTATDFSAGLPDTTAPWINDVSATTNKITLSDDRGDPGVALAAVGRRLAILKRRSIDVLTGYGPDTWQIRTAVKGLGCLDPRSVVETADGCYFLSQHGFAFFDGSTATIISRQINNVVLGHLKYRFTSVISSGWFDCHAVLLDNNAILFTFSSQGQLAGTSSLTYCWLFNIATGTWTTVSSTYGLGGGLYATENFAFALSSNGTTLSFQNLGSIAQPEGEVESVRGKDGAAVISTKWHSRLLELASPFAKTKLHRVIIEYDWAVDGGTDEQFTGPTVTLYDGGGTVLDTYDLPSTADDGREYARKRHVREVFAESNDVQVRIEYTGTARALVQSAFYDVWVEYSVGAEKHSGV